MDELLDVSRISAGRLQLRRESIDLSELVQHSVRGLAESATRAGCAVSVGLYIARQIVEAHGGVIHVESKLREGATFIVKLPL